MQELDYVSKKIITENSKNTKFILINKKYFIFYLSQCIINSKYLTN